MEATVKSFLIALFTMFLFSGHFSASAQEMGPENFTPIPQSDTCTDDPTVQFSYYGYRHCELHHRNIMTKLTGCCDNVGECRVTALRYHGGGMQIEVDGIWCPIDSRSLKLDVIPLDDATIEAIVCAPRSGGVIGVLKACPPIYCVATKPPGT